MNHTLTLSDDKIIFMDDETGNIIVSAEDMPKEVSCGDTVLIHFEEDSPKIQHEYTVSECDVENSILTLDWVTKVEQDLLTEAPVIKFDDADINNPDSIDLKNIVARETQKEQELAAAEEQSKKITAFKNMYSKVYETLVSINHKQPTEDVLETLFEQLVPSSGSCDTVAGEHIRAVMRILYRDYNDGDKFFTGYGIETCGGSAEYLYDNGFSTEIDSILEEGLRLAEEDDLYTEAVMQLAQDVLDNLASNEELFYTENTTDSRSYSYDYIEEHQPTYEFECYASDAVVDLVEEGILTAWDLNSYVEEMLSYESYYHNAKVERPWTSQDTTVVVTDLTKDSYDALKDTFNRDVDSFWRTLVEDNTEDLDDYDEDDE